LIVVDSSILVGIIKGETDAEQVLDLLATDAWAVGAPTLVETRAWCAINLVARSSRWLDGIIGADWVSVVPFGRDMADIASRAFATFGKASGHPAKLNFGDCMAYAVAGSLRAPLLFKGGDFGMTDVTAHSASIRI
jgi:ribonuclease VapC